MGFMPWCNQGHNGGNINSEPFLQGEANFSCGKLVSPLALSCRYIKNTRNLFDDSILIEKIAYEAQNLNMLKEKVAKLPF